MDRLLLVLGTRREEASSDSKRRETNNKWIVDEIHMFVQERGNFHVVAVPEHDGVHLGTKTHMRRDIHEMGPQF